MDAAISDHEEYWTALVHAMFEQNPATVRDAALSSTAPELRAAAVDHLLLGGDAEAHATLARVAADADPDIRHQAIEALGMLADKDPQIRNTLAYLSQTEPDFDMRMFIEDWLMPADQADKGETK